MGTKWVQGSLSSPTTESVENGPERQISHSRHKRLYRRRGVSGARVLRTQDRRSGVQPPVRDLIDGQRVRLGRLMANPERDNSEPDRTLRVADCNHDGSEATCRPRDVRLDAAAESRPVAAFRITRQ